MDFMKLSCEDFIDVLASKEPIPGGGGAAAYVGAIGMALGNMVGSLTVGKKKYADVQDDIIALKVQADALQKDLLELVRRDAEVFEPLSKAYGLPRDTEEQKAEKTRIMEATLKEAAGAPLEIMKKCCEAIDLHQAFADKGTAIAISDVGCGVACCKAALMAASLNVFINTKAMTDKPYAEDINIQADSMLAEYTLKADQIYSQVLSRFRG
ncbi:MAG: cyclodeaminase/cyclohydrolase family protein [Defluviitaleaceae bacterium]|nr:cyclodeaminase/cyclohydrolase family protein [Defluviitaleaceae bacterium]